MMKTIPINLSKGEITASASQGRPSVGRGNTHGAWLSYRQRAALGDFLRDRTPWGQKREPAAVTEDKGTCGDLEPEGLWSPDGKGRPCLRGQRPEQDPGQPRAAREQEMPITPSCQRPEGAMLSPHYER